MNHLFNSDLPNGIYFLHIKTKIAVTAFHLVGTINEAKEKEKKILAEAK